MQKRYFGCPNCRTRMKRTGAKREGSTRTLSGEMLYDYEYECPKCGRYYVYDVGRNLFIPGRLGA